MKKQTIFIILMAIIAIQSWGWYWQTGQTIKAKQKLLDCMLRDEYCFKTPSDTIVLTNNVFYWPDSTQNIHR